MLLWQQVSEVLQDFGTIIGSAELKTQFGLRGTRTPGLPRSCWPDFDSGLFQGFGVRITGAKSLARRTLCYWAMSPCERIYFSINLKIRPKTEKWKKETENHRRKRENIKEKIICCSLPNHRKNRFCILLEKWGRSRRPDKSPCLSFPFLSSSIPQGKTWITIK